MRHIPCCASFCSRIIFSSPVHPSVSPRLSCISDSAGESLDDLKILRCRTPWLWNPSEISYFHIYIFIYTPVRCCFRWCVRCDVLSKAARQAHRRLVLRLQQREKEREMSWISNRRPGRGWKKKKEAYGLHPSLEWWGCFLQTDVWGGGYCSAFGSRTSDSNTELGFVSFFLEKSAAADKTAQLQHSSSFPWALAWAWAPSYGPGAMWSPVNFLIQPTGF